MGPIHRPQCFGLEPTAFPCLTCGIHRSLNSCDFLIIRKSGNRDTIQLTRIPFSPNSRNFHYLPPSQLSHIQQILNFKGYIKFAPGKLPQFTLPHPFQNIYFTSHPLWLIACILKVDLNLTECSRIECIHDDFYKSSHDWVWMVTKNCNIPYEIFMLSAYAILIRWRDQKECAFEQVLVWMFGSGKIRFIRIKMGRVEYSLLAFFRENPYMHIAGIFRLKIGTRKYSMNFEIMEWLFKSVVFVNNIRTFIVWLNIRLE